MNDEGSWSKQMKIPVQVEQGRSTLPMRLLAPVCVLELLYKSVLAAPAGAGLPAPNPTAPGSSSQTCQLPLETKSLSSFQWQADIRAMVDGIERLHISPFHYTTRAKLEQAAAELEARVPHLPPEAVPVRMKQIVALVGDGHTRLVAPPHPTYPLQLYWFDDDLRIVSTLGDDKDLLGGRVKRIGRYDVQEVMRRVSALVSQDENRWLMMNRTPPLLVDATVLWAMGIASEHDQVAIEVERGGKVLKKSLYATSDKIDDSRWLRPFSVAPLYLAHQNDDFWFETVPDTKTIYVIFNHYAHFAGHAQDLLKDIDAIHPDRLIIDMRENGGGNFSLPREYLLPFIKASRTLNRKGHLYIIIGRKTFSAGMSNAADFRNDTNSILVGEPAGERPNSYQENGEFCLPNSHLHVTVSTKHYKFANADPEALLPDERIDIGWSDYEGGNDPVLSWILRQPVSK
jgi:hypothetical protein